MTKTKNVLPPILNSLSPTEIVNYLQNNPNFKFTELELFLINLIDRIENKNTGVN